MVRVKVSGVVVKQVMDNFVLKHEQCGNDDQRGIGVIVPATISECSLWNDNDHWCGGGQSGAFLDLHIGVFKNLDRRSLVNGFSGIESQPKPTRPLNVVGKSVPVVIVGASAAASEQQQYQ